jgi:glucose/arabinose dehydrogenase
MKFAFLSLILSISSPYYAFAVSQPNVNFSDDGKPDLFDNGLSVETVASGLDFPTSMAFLGPDDFLILEKQTGTVKRVLDGSVLPDLVLDVDVSNFGEQGMLGIAITHGKSDDSNKTFVFISYTASYSDGGKNIDNSVYRYEWSPTENNGTGKLVNPVLILDLPSTPGPRHFGGVITEGPDGNLYYATGDADGRQTEAQNIDGPNPDGTSGILRFDVNGGAIINDNKSIFDSDGSMAKYYYAYGIRNSFGLDFDPVTGNLWDTENGAANNDEINLVKPGFNSGWTQVQGMSSNNFEENSLQTLHDVGNYSDPEFVWTDTVGPTAIKFLDSTVYGKYQYDAFVGDISLGNLYRFTLNDDRSELALHGSLSDKVANSDSQLKNVIFGKDFGGISDIEQGPDGYLYIVSFGLGKVFRIVPDS